MSCQTSTWASQCGPAPMPDGRDVQAAVTARGQLRRHALEHDREGARRLERLGVVQQPFAVLAAALDLVAAEGVDRLRGQAQVGHDRDAGRDQLLDLADHAVSRPRA